MVYKPLAVRVALIAGFRRALPVFKYMIVVVVAVVMWESRRDFHTPAFPWLVFSHTHLSSRRVGLSSAIGCSVFAGQWLALDQRLKLQQQRYANRIVLII